MYIEQFVISPHNGTNKPLTMWRDHVYNGSRDRSSVTLTNEQIDHIVVGLLALKKES